MKIFDFVIAGGGASGMAAAIACKRANPNAEVAVIEKNSETGKKILATGNGRCNITNVNYEYFAEVKEFLDSVGILLRIDSEGRAYPHSNSAKDVRDLLSLWMKKLGIFLILKSEVRHISIDETARFLIEIGCENEPNLKIRAQRVLIATGGKAAPQYGSNGSGYSLAKNLGHSYTALRPSLAAIDCEGDFRKFKGVRLPAKVKLVNSKTSESFEESGELQFTDSGVSGICIFNLSRNIVLNLDKLDLKLLFSDYKLQIDFLPEFEESDLVKFLEAGFRKLGDYARTHLLTGILPAKLSQNILEQVEGDADIHEYCKCVAGKIKKTVFNVQSVKGWRDAQVTAGGMKSSEIAGNTFESQIVEGLYFAGEILDYDGICGGYNLSNAFYSGICVGREVAKCIG